MIAKTNSIFTKILCSVILSLSIPASSFAFSDVPTTHLQFKAIKTLEMEKFLQGFPDDTFQPEKLMGKAEFLKLIFDTVGFKPAEKLYNTGFEDVPAGNWSAGYIKKALDLHLISPPQEGNRKFFPLKPLNKLDAIKMAFAIEGISTPYYSDIDPNDLFEDVDVNSPFAYIALAAKQNGIISAKNPTLFSPFKSMTRGDIAELVYQTEIVRVGVGGSVSIPPSEEIFKGLDEVSSKFINNPKFPLLLEVWNKANTEFYYKTNNDQDQLVYGAIEGLVNKLGDKYTVFEEPLAADELSQYLEGEFEGIGIQMDVIDTKLVITNALPGSPAEKAGLKPGDVITKIDQNNVNDLNLEDVLDTIKGEAGTKVHLSIFRKNVALEFEIAREKILVGTVTSKMINNIGYINISQFLSRTQEEFETQLKVLLSSSPKGFIIDLRGNPGGYLDKATAILDHFITEGKVEVQTVSADNVKEVITSTGKGELGKYPIIVLIDGDTASAAEVMSAALQDYKIAKLIGEKSFGKGSVQKIYNYPDESLLKISIAHWLTPSGKDIHGISLTPDIEVKKTTENILNGEDPVLDRALKEIQKN